MYRTLLTTLIAAIALLFLTPALTMTASAQVDSNAAPGQFTQTPDQISDSEEAPDEDAQNEASKEPLPTALEVFNRHIEARGGREALLSKTSLKMIGSMQDIVQNSFAPIEVYAKAPNIKLLRAKFGTVGVRAQGYTGEYRWTYADVSSPTIYEGLSPEVASNFDFYRDLNYARYYPGIEVVRKEIFAGVDCWRVKLITPAKRIAFEFFNVETGIKMGTETPEDRRTTAIIEEWRNWEDVDGVLVSRGYTTYRKSPDDSREALQIVNFRTIEWNTVTDEDLSPPEAVLQGYQEQMNSRQEQGGIDITPEAGRDTDNIEDGAEDGQQR